MTSSEGDHQCLPRQRPSDSEDRPASGPTPSRKIQNEPKMLVLVSKTQLSPEKVRPPSRWSVLHDLGRFGAISGSKRGDFTSVWGQNGEILGRIGGWFGGVFYPVPSRKILTTIGQKITYVSRRPSREGKFPFAPKKAAHPAPFPHSAIRLHHPSYRPLPPPELTSPQLPCILSPWSGITQTP